jgi:hypothetical protein
MTARNVWKPIALASAPSTISNGLTSSFTLLGSPRSAVIVAMFVFFLALSRASGRASAIVTSKPGCSAKSAAITEPTMPLPNTRAFVTGTLEKGVSTSFGAK